MAEAENINIAEFSPEVQKAFRDLKTKAESEKEAIALADDLIAKLSGLTNLSNELKGKLKKIGNFAGRVRPSGTNVKKDRKQDLWNEFKKSMKSGVEWNSKDVRNFLESNSVKTSNPIAFFGDLLKSEIDKTIIKGGENQRSTTYKFK